MAIKTIKAKLVGVAPLLLHNGRLADPLDEIAKALKAVSIKRKKVEADHLEMARLEWMGGLYLRDGKVIIPAEMLEACLVEGAKRSKQGKLFKASVYAAEDIFHLDYEDKPEVFDVDQEWKNKSRVHRSKVKVGTSSVMRTRPIFNNWSLPASIRYQDDMVNEKDVKDALNHAGQVVGFGDWRPRYGRFVVEF